MNIREAFHFSIRALNANRVRSMLTALGLVIGNGSDMIYAYYETAGQGDVEVEADFVKLADVEAVRQQFPERIVAATGVMTQYDRMVIAGREEDVKVIGSDEAYPEVRNLVPLSGRFLDWSDVSLRLKVALLTEKLA